MQDEMYLVIIFRNGIIFKTGCKKVMLNSWYRSCILYKSQYFSEVCLDSSRPEKCQYLTMLLHFIYAHIKVFMDWCISVI